MTRTKSLLIFTILSAILIPSMAYAQSDWRTSCGINNPFDNLECAVDHLESEINIIISNIADLVIVDIQHTTDITNLEGNVTSLQATLDIQALQITELNDLAEHRILKIVDFYPYKNGAFTNVIVYTIKPLLPVPAALEISIFDPSNTLDSIGGCGGLAVFAICEKVLINPVDGTWKVTVRDVRTNTEYTSFFELVDASLPTEKPYT